MNFQIIEHFVKHLFGLHLYQQNIINNQQEIIKDLQIKTNQLNKKQEETIIDFQNKINNLTERVNILENKIKETEEIKIPNLNEKIKLLEEELNKYKSINNNKDNTYNNFNIQSKKPNDKFIGINNNIKNKKIDKLLDKKNLEQLLLNKEKLIEYNKKMATIIHTHEENMKKQDTEAERMRLENKNELNKMNLEHEKELKKIALEEKKENNNFDIRKDELNLKREENSLKFKVDMEKINNDHLEKDKKLNIEIQQNEFKNAQILAEINNKFELEKLNQEKNLEKIKIEQEEKNLQREKELKEIQLKIENETKSRKIIKRGESFNGNRKSKKNKKTNRIINQKT